MSSSRLILQKKITCLFFKCVSVGAISTNICAVELSDWLVFVYANFQKMIWAFVFWLNVWPFMELYEFTGGQEKNSCQAYETHLICFLRISKPHSHRPYKITHFNKWQKKYSEKTQQYLLLWLIQFALKWNDKNPRISSNWSRSAIPGYFVSIPDEIQVIDRQILV